MTSKEANALIKLNVKEAIKHVKTENLDGYKKVHLKTSKYKIK